MPNLSEILFYTGNFHRCFDQSQLQDICCKFHSQLPLLTVINERDKWNEISVENANNLEGLIPKILFYKGLFGKRKKWYTE